MISKDDLESLVRHAVTGVGLQLAVMGITSAGVVESAAGALVIVAGLVWSRLNRQKVAEAVPPEAAAKIAKLEARVAELEGIGTVPVKA